MAFISFLFILVLDILRMIVYHTSSMSQEKNEKNKLKHEKNALKVKYNELKRELINIGYICKGSIVPSYRKCGKLYCKCAKNENAKHGPYWLWTRKEKGKTISKPLSKKQIKLCEEFIQNSKILEKIIKEMREISIKAVNNEK